MLASAAPDGRARLRSWMSPRFDVAFACRRTFFADKELNDKAFRYSSWSKTSANAQIAHRATCWKTARSSFTARRVLLGEQRLESAYLACDETMKTIYDLVIKNVRVVRPHAAGSEADIASATASSRRSRQISPLRKRKRPTTAKRASPSPARRCSLHAGIYSRSRGRGLREPRSGKRRHLEPQLFPHRQYYLTRAGRTQVLPGGAEDSAASPRRLRLSLAP